MDRRLERKLTTLRERIRKLDSALVAFSGAVDSAFLMRICREELGEKAVAVTALSESYPRSELSVARRVAKIIGVKHVVVDPSKLFAHPARGTCRGRNLYSLLKCMAMRLKLRHVLDSSHCDDTDERGEELLAAQKAGVESPLLESDLTKAEIRLLAKELGLPDYGKDAKTRQTPAAKGRKTSKKILTPNLPLARKYAQSLGRGVALRLKGKKAYLYANKARMVALAKRLTKIQKKMESFGFSEVALELSKN